MYKFRPYPGFLHRELAPPGEGDESDPNNASVNVSANVSTNTPPTHYRRVGRHNTCQDVCVATMDLPKVVLVYFWGSGRFSAGRRLVLKLAKLSLKFFDARIGVGDLWLPFVDSQLCAPQLLGRTAPFRLSPPPLAVAAVLAVDTRVLKRQTWP